MKSPRRRRSSWLRSRRTWVIVGIIILVAGAVGTVFALQRLGGDDDTTQREYSTGAMEEKKQKGPPTVRVAAMGDMLAHDTINMNAHSGDGYNYSHFFSNIRDAYLDADLVFCNQEGLSSGGEFGISGYPAFNAPIEFAAGLQAGAGCNMINLANNHMGDKGAAATNATLDVWDELKPLLISGANRSAEEQRQNVSYATINGIKVAFVAFADFNNNAATPSYSVNSYHDEGLVNSLVSQARKEADVVIVSMHWGVEDSHRVSGDQRRQAEKLAALGVDVIIGTGPHVLQEVATVPRAGGGRTVVWYSLGNMLSSQLEVDQLVSGIAGFDIVKQTDGSISITNLTFTPTYMHYEWTAQEAAANDLMARKNAHLYLLDTAAELLSRSLLNTTIQEQRKAVSTYIGSLVVIK